MYPIVYLDCIHVKVSEGAARVNLCNSNTKPLLHPHVESRDNGALVREKTTETSSPPA